MTTDERLAALEAKMDALTAPPSDYYTSRYSGEEIDAAIAAVPGKAETAQLCNRNLLDNWYFGNPADQRGGYVVLPGTTYYDNTWTAVGTTTGYLKIDSIIPTGGAWITIGGTQYLVSAPSDSVVRGYVGYSYGIDRWIVERGTILVSENGITLTPGTVIDQYLEQTIDSERMCTISVLCDEVVYALNRTKDSESNWCDAGGSIGFRFSHLNDKDIISFVNNAQTNKTIAAAKLELGSQQTLAHQDAGGNWVLNEIPDYGEQLRRCQRYFYRLKAQNSNNFGVWALGYLQTTTQGRFLVNFPNTMRTLPTHTMSGTLQMYSKTSSYAVTSLSHQAFNGNSLLLMANCAANEGFVVGNTVSLGAMNDPNAYIDFSADL